MSPTEDSHLPQWDGDLRVPKGFIELRVLPYRAVWHVRVADIVSYGPERFGDKIGDGFEGCHVQLRGESKGRCVFDRMIDIAKRINMVQHQNA